MALDRTYDDFSFLSQTVYFFFQKFHDCSLKQVFSASGGWLKYVYAASSLHCCRLPNWRAFLLPSTAGAKLIMMKRLMQIHSEVIK